MSWRSPLAHALLNLGVGDVATLQTPSGEEDLEVVKVEYLPDPVPASGLVSVIAVTNVPAALITDPPQYGLGSYGSGIYGS